MGVSKIKKEAIVKEIMEGKISLANIADKYDVDTTTVRRVAKMIEQRQAKRCEDGETAKKPAADNAATHTVTVKVNDNWVKDLSLVMVVEALRKQSIILLALMAIDIFIAVYIILELLWG
jgi:transposase-like protein